MVSYAYAVQVVTWVPLLNILFGLYGLYLCAFGFQEVHSTTYQRAATIAALLLLVLMVGELVFGILLGFQLSTAQGAERSRGQPRSTRRSLLSIPGPTVWGRRPRTVLPAPKNLLVRWQLPLRGSHSSCVRSCWL